MKGAVPTCSQRTANVLAEPKSTSLAVWPSALSTTFNGFRSRCATSRKWQCSRPAASCAKSCRDCIVRRRCWAALPIARRRLSGPAYSMRSARCPSECMRPSSRTTDWWASFWRMTASLATSLALCAGSPRPSNTFSAARRPALRSSTRYTSLDAPLPSSRTTTWRSGARPSGACPWAPGGAARAPGARPRPWPGSWSMVPSSSSSLCGSCSRWPAASVPAPAPAERPHQRLPPVGAAACGHPGSTLPMPANTLCHQRLRVCGAPLAAPVPESSASLPLVSEAACARLRCGAALHARISAEGAYGTWDWPRSPKPGAALA
mmetsp:Transcript_1664/g.4572  ORF Transcript_1664/g.4572 Transcript_1664/m.4572 type:complete len:320 (-) Transcript_1664:3-962(-)